MEVYGMHTFRPQQDRDFQAFPTYSRYLPSLPSATWYTPRVMCVVNFPFLQYTENTDISRDMWLKLRAITIQTTY